MRMWLSVIVVALLQSPAAPKKGGNPEAAKVKNPIAMSPESTAAGKRIYTRMCSRCHGSEGKGDGTAASVAVPDLTDAAWDYGGSDGDIFAVIHDGVSTDMEGYAARLSDTDIWNVVNFVRSVGPKP
ncbi:MAG: yliI 6 [Acidobacteria bacterium]|nr:yliI 6 [Acidobacteriota bacterium]